MKAILKREWNAYFQNIIGWLYLAATAALYGLYFFVYNLNYGYAKVSYALNAITFLYLITVPVLTMRSLAEEQKSKTDQLILTAPVSVGKIVLAKPASYNQRPKADIFLRVVPVKIRVDRRILILNFYMRRRIFITLQRFCHRSIRAAL